MIRKACLGVGIGMAVMLAGCELLPQDERPIVRNLEESSAQAGGEVQSVSDDGQAGSAQAGATGLPDSAVPVVAAPSQVLTPSSVVGEARLLIQNRSAQELRTTYNGNYGASLLFRPGDLTYFAVLFENRTVWQAVRTQDSVRAEKAYREYVEESARLAQAQLDRITLRAKYDSLEQELVSKADELTALQRDREWQEQQEVLIRSQQAQYQHDVDRLVQQEKEVREQLRALQRQIEALRR